MFRKLFIGLLLFPSLATAAGYGSAAPVKEWTVMLFANGKNNLDPAQFSEINAMESVGSNKDVNLVVQFGRLGNSYSSDNWSGARRYLLEKDSDPNHITSPVLWQADKVDMGDYRSVIDFAQWTAAKFPAKRYFFIWTNHGSGWFDPKPGTMRGATRGFSFDDETKNYVRVSQMNPMMDGVARALHKRVDIMFNAGCLMQMVEIAYENRNQADVIMGSEETAMTAGAGAYEMPLVLGAMMQSPTLDTDTVARLMVQYYGEYLGSHGQNVTLSAVRGKTLWDLKRALNDWAALAMDINDVGAARSGKYFSLRFEYPVNTDLVDFITRYTNSMTATGPKADQLRQLSNWIINYVKNRVVVANSAVGEVSGATGIAITIPTKDNSWTTSLPKRFEPYGLMAFAKDTNWKQFCDYMDAIK